MEYSKSSDYEFNESRKNGWYLLVIDGNTKKATDTFNYREIKYNRTENITTTALKHLKKDGLLYTPFDVKDLLKYKIYLLKYSKGEVTSRYTMKYKEEISLIDGFYEGWEYEIRDQDAGGKFKPHDDDYSWWKAHRLPITISLFQGLFILCIQFFSKDIASSLQTKGNFEAVYDLTNAILAFLVFYIGLMHSSFSVLTKDFIKLHYLKDNLKRILASTFVFEIPVIISAIYTVFKLSHFAGKFDSVFFNGFTFISLCFIAWKIWSTYDLERGKKSK